MAKKGELTFIEATSVVAGLGVGGGVMAVPYLASFSGIVPILLIIAAAYVFSVLLHLMIAELVVNADKHRQMIELFRYYLFKGRLERVWTWLLFVIVITSLYSMLAGYIIGCGDIVEGAVGLPSKAGQIATYVISATVVWFGLKAMGRLEKFGVIGIVVVLAVLTLGSLRVEWHPIPILGGGAKEQLAFYAMLMYSFSCLFSIPEAAVGLGDRVKLLPWAIVLGIALNLAIVLVVTLMSLGVSNEVTPVAITGWASAVGPWALQFGSVIVYLALLTSYLGYSYIIAVMIQEHLNWGYRVAWLLATLPTLLLALSNVRSFIQLMQITGGATGVVVVVMVLPALRVSRRNVPREERRFDMGIWGNIYFQVLMLAAHFAMVAGSLVSVD